MKYAQLLGWCLCAALALGSCKDGGGSGSGSGGSGAGGDSGGEGGSASGGAAAGGEGGDTGEGGAGGVANGGSGGGGAGGGGSGGKSDAGVVADAAGDSGPAAPKRNACLLPLGDSITQADTLHLSYRYWLWKKLKDAGRTVNFIGSRTTHRDRVANAEGPAPAFPDPTFDKDHEGHWGFSTAQMVGVLSNELPKYTPGIVLIHLGSNDAFGGTPPATTLTLLGELISQLRAKNPDVAVLVAKILPTVNAGNNDRFNLLNAVIPKFVTDTTTARSPVILVDHNTDFSVANEEYDGIHPNEMGEKKMADRWYAALVPLLDTAGPCQ